MDSKLHYKMFKAGRKWVYASIATAGLGLVGINTNSVNVHADANKSDASNQVNSDAATTPVSAASVSLETKSSSSAATTKADTTVANSVASSAATKSTTSSAATTLKQAANSVTTTSSSSTVVTPTSASSSASSATTKTSTGVEVSTATAKKTDTQKSYVIDNTYKLDDDEGSSQKTNNKIIVAHATGTYASAKNVATFEKREWSTDETYVQYIVGDGGKVYAVGEEGYVAWGAGQWANENAPVQVELAQTYSNTQFKKDYTTYVNLLRDSAQKWNIPVTLDDKKYTGIKSHVWISNNVWGDHVDPYGYLATHGVSKTQFAHDLQYGFGTSSNTNANTNKNSSTANGSSTTNKTTAIKVGTNVKIKTSAKKWATGQAIYSAVKGKTYKVIQTNGSKLLLDKVVSWINTSDVTVPGSTSTSSNKTSNTNKTTTPTTNKTSSAIKVGSKVTIKTSAKKWATGQNIYDAVKGKTYKVIQTNGSKLLLDKVVSWINKSDVTVPGATSTSSNKTSNTSKTTPTTTNKTSSAIKVGSKVTIKTSAKKWATGQNIYGAVKGKTYKVIQTNGSKLLLDKVVSWINKSDVTVPGATTTTSSTTNKVVKPTTNKTSSAIKVGSKVTIKTSAKKWATGQAIYNGVKGKTYKVIQTNGSKLLLDQVVSWINKADVTVPGSTVVSEPASANNASSAKVVKLSNANWTSTQSNFVNKIANDVINVCKDNNLYASVAMAQAVLESAYGTSGLAQKANNLFGIKADSTWKGAYVTMKTQEVINGRTVTVNAKFRKYSSIKDSIADYAKKLESRTQYSNAFTNKAKNYVASIKAIKAGGYATSTTYVSSLVNCVNKNGFYKLDGLASAINL